MYGASFMNSPFTFGILILITYKHFLLYNNGAHAFDNIVDYFV